MATARAVRRGPSQVWGRTARAPVVLKHPLGFAVGAPVLPPGVGRNAAGAGAEVVSRCGLVIEAAPAHGRDAGRLGAPLGGLAAVADWAPGRGASWVSDSCTGLPSIGSVNYGRQRPLHHQAGPARGNHQLD